MALQHIRPSSCHIRTKGIRANNPPSQLELVCAKIIGHSFHGFEFTRIFEHGDHDFECRILGERRDVAP